MTSYLKKVLGLALASFGVLLTFTILEVSYFYPEVKAYFDRTGTLADQSLAARSRQYLTDSLEIISTRPYTEALNEEAKEKLDVAYGLLNIGYYLKTYSCTEPALNKIDDLYNHLEHRPIPDTTTYLRNTVTIIQCTETIQTELDAKRTLLANKMLEEITFQLEILVVGTLVVFISGILVWGVHRKQARLITLKKSEAEKWIQHAMEDSLTGAKNRRAFDIDTKKLSENHTYSLLMCDIDYFKQYNDNLGHLEGDRALQLISKTIQTALRDTDSLYRYGGEELAVILRDTSLEQAEVIGQRILALIRDLKLPHEVSEHKVVTVSIGCAASIEETNTVKLISLADSRLYQAKQGGRNCLYTSCLYPMKI